MNKNKQVLDIIHQTLLGTLSRSRKEYWSNPLDREPRQLVDVLSEWVPQLRERKLLSLPHLDDPVDGLYRRLEGESDPDTDSHIIQNSFQLLEDCLTTALACYRQKVSKPRHEEMRILVRLAARALEFKKGLDESRWRMRHKICSFFTNYVFSPEGSDFPEDVVRHAFHQFALYWWAIPEQYKGGLFSLARGAALGLKGDFILHAADIVRDIFLMGQETALGAAEAPPKRAVTSYHSVKGGTGKSTLALAHAVVLSEDCTGEETVAILDLDMLNPSLLAMHGLARAPKEFVFLESILASPKRPQDGDLEDAFVRSTEEHPILCGSCFGTSTGREPLLKMLSGHIETWQIVVDNLRAVVDYLFRRRACKHVILDNSAGFFSVAIPGAIVTAEQEGTFVLVSTLDAFDAGSVPIAQTAYDYLFRHRTRVMVFNKCPDRDTREVYEEDEELILAQAWSEALSRAGVEPVVDVSCKKTGGGNALWDGAKGEVLFINTHKMRHERGPWGIKFVDYLEPLASLWALTPAGRPMSSLEDFMAKIHDIKQIKELSRSIMSGDA